MFSPFPVQILKTGTRVKQGAILLLPMKKKMKTENIFTNQTGPKLAISKTLIEAMKTTAY